MYQAAQMRNEFSALNHEENGFVDRNAVHNFLTKWGTMAKEVEILDGKGCIDPTEVYHFEDGSRAFLDNPRQEVYQARMSADFPEESQAYKFVEALRAIHRDYDGFISDTELDAFVEQWMFLAHHVDHCAHQKDPTMYFTFKDGSRGILTCPCQIEAPAQAYVIGD